MQAPGEDIGGGERIWQGLCRKIREMISHPARRLRLKPGRRTAPRIPPAQCRGEEGKRERGEEGKGGRGEEGRGKRGRGEEGKRNRGEEGSFVVLWGPFWVRFDAQGILWGVPEGPFWVHFG